MISVPYYHPPLMNFFLFSFPLLSLSSFYLSPPSLSHGASFPSNSSKLITNTISSSYYPLPPSILRFSKISPVPSLLIYFPFVFFSLLIHAVQSPCLQRSIIVSRSESILFVSLPPPESTHSVPHRPSN